MLLCVSQEVSIRRTVDLILQGAHAIGLRHLVLHLKSAWELLAPILILFLLGYCLLNRGEISIFLDGTRQSRKIIFLDQLLWPGFLDDGSPGLLRLWLGPDEHFWHTFFVIRSCCKPENDFGLFGLSVQDLVVLTELDAVFEDQHQTLRLVAHVMMFLGVRPELLNSFENLVFRQVVGLATDLSGAFTDLATDIAEVVVFAVVHI